jgi:hypothetical protein
MSIKFTSAVRFKCNQSGNIFEFFTDHDINTMRKHPEYTEVLLEVVEEEPTVEQPKRGRPPKLQKD